MRLFFFLKIQACVQIIRYSRVDALISVKSTLNVSASEGPRIMQNLELDKIAFDVNLSSAEMTLNSLSMFSFTELCWFIQKD